MTEAELEAACRQYQSETRLFGGPLFDRILHSLKVPQKRLRACLSRLGLDKAPPPSAPAKNPSTPYEEPPQRELKQRVIHGSRAERPETLNELRDSFDPS